MEQQHLTRAEQSRINGARSKGPVTPEGKLRSATKHFVHGRHSQYFTLLKEEDAKAFRDLRHDLEQVLAPRNPFERRLVRELASIEWRLQRLAMMETAILDHECRAQRLALERDLERPDPGVIVSTAAHHLLESSPLPAFLATRSSQLTYQRDATLRHLSALRRTSPHSLGQPQSLDSRPLRPEIRTPVEPSLNPSVPVSGAPEPAPGQLPSEPPNS